jgi:hypothetical protein
MYAVVLIYHSRPKNILSEYIKEVNNDLRKIFEWSSEFESSIIYGAAYLQGTYIASSMGKNVKCVILNKETQAIRAQFQKVSSISRLRKKYFHVTQTIHLQTSRILFPSENSPLITFPRTQSLNFSLIGDWSFVHLFTTG